MPNIRYVCLSDLHLGEEDSLLTDVDDVSRPSPTVRALAECLSSLIGRNDAGVPKPSLVLNGDVLDLALHPEQQTLAAFEQLLRALMPPNGGLFSEIIYIPGNHDHHMWSSARDAQYAQYLEQLGPKVTPERPWDTTKVMMDCHGKDHLVNAAVTAIARRIPHLAQCQFEILTAYPNFGIGAGGGRTVVFHHGHFIESAYHFFSTLGTLLFPKQSLPADVYTLERENGAWIDFLWSALGSSGRIGEDIERIYDASTRESSLLQLAETLAHGISEQFPYPKGVPRFLREWVAKIALEEVARHCTRGLERCQGGSAVLSAEATQGLHWYVEGPLRKQLEVETGRVPDSLTFVLGHTHKPEEQAWDHTAVLNTGGWVVDAPEPQSLHGAAAVLVSDDLSCVSLRFYNEGFYTARVTEAPSAGHGDFYRQMAELVKADAEPWKSWFAVSRSEVERRLGRFAAIKKVKAAHAHA
jgi:hypothetical protein